MTHLTAADGVIQATVVGGEEYAVQIDTTGQGLQVFCTCPYFMDRLETCKHVWATLLTAEARGIPLVPPGVSPESLELEPLPHDEDGLDAIYGDGADDETDDWAGGEQGPVSGADLAAARASMARPSSERWRHVLQAIAGAPGVAGSPAGQRLTTEALLFVIDVQASIASGALVVEVMTRTRKSSGEWAQPKPARITSAQIRALPHGEDRQLLERLLGVRPHYDVGYGYGDVAELRRFALSGVLAVDMLPKLCAGDRAVARVPAPPDPSRVAKPSPAIYLPL